MKTLASDQSQLFPASLCGYIKYKDIPSHSHTHKSHFALYKNSKGKIAFGKIIHDPKHFVHAYWLNNERILYPVLHAYHPARTRVSVPRLIGHETRANSTFLLLEYVSAKTLEKVSDKKKIAVIEQYLAYLDGIASDKVISPIEHALVKRSGIYYALLFPFFLVRAYIKNPSFREVAMCVIRTYYDSFHAVITKGDLRFIHRDINDSNILVSDNHIWIIDFQSSMIADYRFELANILINMWNHAGVRTYFYKIPRVKKSLMSRESRRVYVFYSLYAAIFEISKRTGHIEEWLLEYLKHIIRISKHHELH